MLFILVILHLLFIICQHSSIVKMGTHIGTATNGGVVLSDVELTALKRRLFESTRRYCEHEGLFILC
jgi:hypothetical protein